MCSVGRNKHFRTLSQIWDFSPAALESLSTVEQKTTVPLAKVPEDSKPAFVLTQNNQK